MDLHFFPTNGNIISAACQSSNYDQLLYQGTTSVVPKTRAERRWLLGRVFITATMLPQAEAESEGTQPEILSLGFASRTPSIFPRMT
jgi:hypothetical protein